MADNSALVRALYKKLLTLYPRDFEEKFGESMAQTFNDLCNERKQARTGGLFGFVGWLFIETAIGIGKEYMLRSKEGTVMKPIFTILRTPAILSLLLVLPFAILEFVFSPVNMFRDRGLIVLFGFLWLLALVFIVILMPMVRTLRTGHSPVANPTVLLFRGAALALIAIMWVSIILDQLPCFLGVPNCD